MIVARVSAVVVALALLSGAGCGSTSAARTGDAAAAHARPASVADPGFIDQYAATYRFRLGSPRAITVTPGGDSVLFLRSGPRSFVQDLYAFDPATGTEEVLLTADAILQGAAEELSAEEKARRERMRQSSRGIASYRLSKDGKQLLVPLSGKLYVVDRATGETTELPSDGGSAIDPQFSADATKVATVRAGDLWVIDVAKGKQKQLTKRPTGDAHEHVTHGLAEFVAQEEMGRMSGYWWSPDGKHLAYQRTDTSQLERMHLADPGAPEKGTHEWPYPRPGKDNAIVELGIVASKGGKTKWVQWDREAYPYLATVKWPKGGPLNILVQNREQTEQVLLAVDPKKGTTTPLLTETDAAWLNLDQDFPHWLPDGAGFLWSTERGGAWQIEHRGADGALLGTVTSPDLGFRHLLHVDAPNSRVLVRAAADPTLDHVVTLPLGAEPGDATTLTEERGYHSGVFGKDTDVWVHSFAGLDGTSSWKVVRGTGADATELGQLSSVGETPEWKVQMELTTATIKPAAQEAAQEAAEEAAEEPADGAAEAAEATEHTLHAGIIRPRNFKKGTKYAVLLHVYGGPHARMVESRASRYYLDQWLADHGFVVVVIDGRGTPNRGRAWERVIKHNLVDIPLDDQAAGLLDLGSRYPELDMTRVGVFGWSFGGYLSAMAVMRRPDVFHAGVAGAPVADWLDYDTHYTERYMGLPEPNAAGYEASNVLTYAKDLTRPLLIMHGTTDDNVYFKHALRMSDALFRAGKHHEFLPLTGFTHMVADPVVGRALQGRIIGFFEGHLLGPKK